METESSASVNRVECTAARDPAVRLFILALMMLMFAAWCYVEAYVQKKYPYPDPWNINAYANYALNHYGPFVFGPPGLVVLVHAIVFLRRRLIADEEGIGYAGKGKLRWDRVDCLDASRLESKGIMHLQYGGGRRLTLDSWKLNGFRELVAFVEKRVPREKHHVV